MAELKAMAVLLIQFVSIEITYLILRKWPQFSSIKIGVGFTLLILLIADALPWISIRKTVFTFQKKWHHSRIGIICIALAILYKGIRRLLYDRWELVRTLQYHFEEKFINIWFINVQFFYFCLGVAITLILTQIHEIAYFGTMKFPDRGFPLDLKLKLGSTLKDQS